MSRAAMAEGFLQSREMPAGVHLLQASARPGSENYCWCVVCERTFRRDRQPLDAQVLCPYPGCDGGVMFEPWAWSQILQMNPRYPDVPLEHVAYPFFGGMES